ncbi:hypothetical protein [Engelhardtia mirabilis]|uniref:Uncharacterized protein n=1 Tax=Engelhardtia mirabilis TaxID=2528011 RepID=A0A518BR75_9BACT|nr:hypothetical protein Pla133_45960 [Planctomycetes bacterium Pla133]QDV03802.1 hypothetical protein Pla86_45940 [Planctomycetes bacterium Pla86]
MALVDISCGSRAGVLRVGLIVVVALGVLVVAGVVVAQRAAAVEPWYRASTGPLGPETMVDLREKHGPVVFSPAARIALPQGLPARLDAKWTWRVGDGDWMPLPFEGTRFVGTTDGGDDLVRTVTTGRLDGCAAIERGFGGGTLPLREVESALILCELDGRLALRPWLRCRLGGEFEAATTLTLLDEAGIEPLALPETHALPTVASAGIEAQWTPDVTGRAFEGLFELRLVDRSLPLDERVPLLVRLELTCDGLPDGRD